jgi:hypothetical protein
MPKKKINRFTTEDIRIDKSLNKYVGKVMFPEKLADANRRLEKYGLPKELEKDNTPKKG